MGCKPLFFPSRNGGCSTKDASMRKAILILAVMTFLTIFSGLGAGPTSLKKTIDDLMLDSIKRWRVPGAALAIVKDGQLMHMSGYGIRKLGNPGDKVTPDTVFPIASCTKPFTTLALAMLVDQGKMDWD